MGLINFNLSNVLKRIDCINYSTNPNNGRAGSINAIGVYNLIGSGLDILTLSCDQCRSRSVWNYKSQKKRKHSFVFPKKA